jgi:hypothetical protein
MKLPNRSEYAPLKAALPASYRLGNSFSTPSGTISRKHETGPQGGFADVMLFCVCLCLFVASISLPANAQEVIAPPPEVSTTPPASRQIQSGGSPVSALSGITPMLSREGPLAQWGLVSVRPHLLYRLLYGDGIQSSPGQPVTTAIQQFAPGILFGLGTHWTLDYTPTWTLYSSHAFRNTLDHAVSLLGGTSYGDWTFGFSQGYVSSSPTLVETGQQTRQEIYSTGINASYHLGIRTLLDMAVSQNVRSADTFTSSRDWSTSDWLHYQFSPRLDAAIGLSCGYVNVSAGSDMTYTRPQGQITWKATDKISVNVQGGVENRKFHSGGAGDLNSPVYGASVQYQPVETTRLILGATRDVSASYFENQVIKSTGWNAGLEQRLLQEFYLSVGFAQRKARYVATTNGFTAGRDDQNDSFDVRLRTTFLRRGSIAVLYQINHNSSNFSGYGFSSHQIGLEIGYRF